MIKDITSPYACPTCGIFPPAHEGEIYIAADGKEYPRYKNTYDYYTDYGMGHGRTEVHYCDEYKLEFDNGDM